MRTFVYMYACMYVHTYTQTLIIGNQYPRLDCNSLLEIAPSVLDPHWAQDSLIFSLTFWGKLGPYIDQGRSNTWV